MNNIVKFLLRSLEATTLDMIPFWFNRYYVMNSDKSGYFMPSKYNVVDREVVYYLGDVSHDAKKARDDYSSQRYRAGLLNALIAHLISIVVLVIVYPDKAISGVVLYAVTLLVAGIVVNFVEAIVAAVNMSKNSDFVILRVEGGLGKHSGISDRYRAVHIKDMLNSESVEQSSEAENSRIIRQRI